MTKNPSLDQKKAVTKKGARTCPICGKFMMERYGSPKYLCKCGHGEGFVYPHQPRLSLNVK